MPKTDAVQSVCGTPLEPCSESGMPQTGYTREGRCTSHRKDSGSHHVCIRNVGTGAAGRNFCDVTGQPDWCAAKKDWCVCEWAFDRAVQKAGCDDFDVKCEATNQLALVHYERAGKTHAAECLRSKCQKA